MAIFTGNRAEYGLLKHLALSITKEEQLELMLIVSGSHLAKQYGFTVSEIEEDGIEFYHPVKLSIADPNNDKVEALFGQTLEGVGKFLRDLRPSILILLGDRFETFAAAVASHLCKIPILHIHGGETTIGSLDDNMRHAITQLSTWHFTAASIYSKKIMQMGKHKDSVFTIGPMVIDSLKIPDLANKQSFSSQTGFCFGSKNYLITFHPETCRADNGKQGLISMLAALSKCKGHILFTRPNFDEGGQEILELIFAFKEIYDDRCWYIPSLGHKLYIEALMLFDAVVGNSSSGIIEAPLCGISSINIGDRQKGRLRFGDVIDVDNCEMNILKELQKIESGDISRTGQINFSQASPTHQILEFLLSRDDYSFPIDRNDS